MVGAEQYQRASSWSLVSHHHSRGTGLPCVLQLSQRCAAPLLQRACLRGRVRERVSRALITSPGSRGAKLLPALPLKLMPREVLLPLSQPAGHFAMSEFPHSHRAGTEGAHLGRRMRQDRPGGEQRERRARRPLSPRPFPVHRLLHNDPSRSHSDGMERGFFLST